MEFFGSASRWGLKIFRSSTERRNLASEPKAITNGILAAVGNLVAAIAGFITSVLIVRSLSAETYGQVSYFLWLSGTLSALFLLAFPHSLTKIGAELRGMGNTAGARYVERIVFGFVGAVNGIGAIVIVLYGLHESSNDRLYYIVIALSLIFFAVSRIQNSRFLSRQMYVWGMYTSISAAIGQAALVVGVFYEHGNGPLYFCALATGSLFSCIGLVMGNHRLREPSTQLPLAERREVLGKYLGYLLPSSLAILTDIVVWQRSEVFFLKLYGGAAQVGYYSIAYTIYSLFLSLGWALSNGFYPAVSKAYGEGRLGELHDEVRSGFLALLVYGGPLSFGGVAILKTVIVLVYGSKMLPAASVTNVLFIGLIPGVLSPIMSVLLNAAGQVWLSVGVGVCMAVLNIGLDLLLIPHMGPVGAAASSTASQIVNTALFAWLAFYRNRVRIPARSSLKILGIAFITTYAIPTLVTTIIGPPSISVTVVLMLASAGLYLFLMWKMGFTLLFTRAATSR